ncbi:type III secretion system chaperone [Aliiroseovarius crassostreae]|uniref:type III secretion system chaperone n=1 Tax=Aliiroseovarius crassostreae TaxID=154981 RepID=UPI003C7A4E3A
MRVLIPLCLTLALAMPVALCSGAQAQAQPETQAPSPPDVMTVGGMAAILRAIDPNVQAVGARFSLTINGTAVLVIADPRADRMRAMTRVGPVDALDQDMMQRLLQANFDAVLDARYAIANDQVWAAFIHPLSPLEPRQLVSGLAQMVNAAQSFGTTFSGGGVQFGGGDSNALQQDLADRLRGKGLPL